MHVVPLELLDLVRVNAYIVCSSIFRLKLMCVYSRKKKIFNGHYYYIIVNGIVITIFCNGG